MVTFVPSRRNWFCRTVGGSGNEDAVAVMRASTVLMLEGTVKFLVQPKQLRVLRRTW